MPRLEAACLPGRSNPRDPLPPDPRSGRRPIPVRLAAAFERGEWTSPSTREPGRARRSPAQPNTAPGPAEHLSAGGRLPSGRVPPGAPYRHLLSRPARIGEGPARQPFDASKAVADRVGWPKGSGLRRWASRRKRTSAPRCAEGGTVPRRQGENRPERRLHRSGRPGGRRGHHPRRRVVVEPGHAATGTRLPDGPGGRSTSSAGRSVTTAPQRPEIRAASRAARLRRQEVLRSGAGPVVRHPGPPHCLSSRAARAGLRQADRPQTMEPGVTDLGQACATAAVRLT